MHTPLPARGAVVWIRARRWRVERAERDRGVVRLDVADHHDRLTFLAPYDRIGIASSPRLRRVRPRRALRRMADSVRQAAGIRTLLSALEARVEILPHQLEPALAVLGGTRRILLADEVGLGKTIEASLVIAELARRREGMRALLVVPASLASQWHDELFARFGLPSEVAGSGTLEHLARDGRLGDNPWRRSRIWIASLDYVKQRHVLDGMPGTPWDVLVVDEAHDVCGDSDRHDACAELARRSRHVLLLTATPHSGDEQRFARLQRLGALPGLSDRLTIFRRRRTDLGPGHTRHVRWRHLMLSAAEIAVLDALIAFERRILQSAGRPRHDAALLLLSLFRKRALSTMYALDISLTRRLAWLDGSTSSMERTWNQARLDFEGEGDTAADVESLGLCGDVGMPADEERRWLRRLRALAATAKRRETKLTYVTRLVRRSQEPLVIFTEFRDSLAAIAACLDSRPRRRDAAATAWREVTILHGGQSQAERRQSLGHFLESRSRILLATDVAGQGLNLQSRSRWVVSLELPWQPAKLEQRIGRVDRIGQTRRVHATLVAARHEAESGLLARLARRTLTAQLAMGDDAPLDPAPISEMGIARALLASPATNTELPAPHRISLSRTWRLTARAAAVHLLKKRRLDRPDDHVRDTSLLCWTSTRRLPKFRALCEGQALVLTTVPIVDQTGSRVECWLLGIRVPARMLDAANRGALLDALRQIAAARLRSRLTRLKRLVAADASRRADVERAIMRHLWELRYPDEAQGGLFDGREIRAFDSGRSEADRLARDANLRIAAWSHATELDIGGPTIDVVFAPR